MKLTLRIAIVCCILGLACEKSPSLNRTAISEQILEVMNAQVEAWNSGDIEGFVEGYLRSDSLRFASGQRVSYGWQTLVERYRQGYPDKAAMGELRFSEIDIRAFSTETALVFGKWSLERQDDNPWGFFYFGLPQNNRRLAHRSRSHVGIIDVNGSLTKPLQKKLVVYFHPVYRQFAHRYKDPVRKTAPASLLPLRFWG